VIGAFVELWRSLCKVLMFQVASGRPLKDLRAAGALAACPFNRLTPSRKRLQS
jgi:hypothetical protein